MFLAHNNLPFRNHSAFSKRISDHALKKDSHKVILKQSNSKTTLQVCPTQRSQSQANQTLNHLAFSQDLQSPRLSEFHIKTFIRFRPDKIINHYSYNVQEDTIQHSQKSLNKKIAIIDKKKILCEDNFFIYDRVFQSHCIQEQIYNCVCKQMVEHFVRGFNSTVFAYGQTGSGKTYTMFGDSNQDKMKGIIPSAVKDIFASVRDISHESQNGVNSQVIVSCSMLQIYKETMIDLFSNQKADLKIKQNQFFNVANLTIKQVRNQDQMHEILKIGNQSKKIRQTCMNEASSRSHVIFTIYLEVRKEHQKRLSKFNLVDLAGSQKVSKSKVDGQGLQEAKKINLSLSCLGNTINALLKRNDHIPYRQSKLTRLLYESLGGNALTRLIVTCSSQQSQIQETLSSLKFASRAKNLKTNPLINTLRKSQKSVSRIAYQNLKTNLNKAQYKLKRINNIVIDFKVYLAQEKNSPIVDKINNQNKQNLSINSNHNQSKNKKQDQNYLTFQDNLKKYIILVENIQMVLSNSNKDLIQTLKSNKKTKYIQTIISNQQKPLIQTLQQPFLLIDQQLKQQIIAVDPIKISQQINEKSNLKQIKKKVLLKQNHKNSDSLSYWEIIKMQQKQIQILKNKLINLEQSALKQIKQKQFKDSLKKSIDFQPTQPNTMNQTRKNSILSIVQKDEKDQNEINEFLMLCQVKKVLNQNQNSKKGEKKLNIKIPSKILPIKQIYLNSPRLNEWQKNLGKTNIQSQTNNSKQKTTSFSKNFKQISIDKKQDQKIRDRNEKDKLKINMLSPRQFMPTQYFEQNNQKQTTKSIQNVLKQIYKKLEHRSEYDKFEKRILMRQLELLMISQLQNDKKRQNQIEQNELNQKQKLGGAIKQKNCNNKQEDPKRKLVMYQTNQLLISQTKYIQHLQTTLFTLFKKQQTNRFTNQQLQKAQDNTSKTKFINLR